MDPRSLYNSVLKIVFLNLSLRRRIEISEGLIDFEEGVCRDIFNRVVGLNDVNSG
jgi:hypothetical protein